MRKLILATLVVLVLLSTVCGAAQVPPLRSYVNDYASMLSPQTVQELEGELAQFEKTDSTQIVVLTIPSLEGDVLEEYSIKVVEAWKIGQKGRDNGALLLIVKNDRKIRIEVGRGLEGKLTDLVSGRIVRNEISPAFKQGDFDAGVVAGVRAIEATVRGEYQAEPRDLREGKKGANPIFTLLLFVGVAVIFLGGMSRVLGGLAGAVGLPIAASLSLGASGFILILLAIAGFVLGLVLSFLFSSGGRGGFFGGGPFFGGGFGGGGFGGGGGFSGGGGTFGGGGASGDW
jgi:uncharacterized protein